MTLISPKDRENLLSLLAKRAALYTCALVPSASVFAVAQSAAPPGQSIVPDSWIMQGGFAGVAVYLIWFMTTSLTKSLDKQTTASEAQARAFTEMGSAFKLMQQAFEQNHSHKRADD